jgi:molecular chaperone GrpE
VSAEFANFRKQNEKRQSEIIHQAAARLAGELLPVLDAFEAAVQQGVEGIDHVYDQLLAALRKEGLEDLATVGEPFDPHRHEAAMTEPAADADDGPVVAQVLRAGYGWNGRVLRAAMVAVRG